MTCVAGIDVSLEESSICVMEVDGEVIREVKIASAPKPLVKFFRQVGFDVSRIGLEAGPLSQWLYDALTEAGYRVALATSAVGSTAEANRLKADGPAGP